MNSALRIQQRGIQYFILLILLTSCDKNKDVKSSIVIDTPSLIIISGDKSGSVDKPDAHIFMSIEHKGNVKLSFDPAMPFPNSNRKLSKGELEAICIGLQFKSKENVVANIDFRVSRLNFQDKSVQYSATFRPSGKDEKFIDDSVDSSGISMTIDNNTIVLQQHVATKSKVIFDKSLKDNIDSFSLSTYHNLDLVPTITLSNFRIESITR